MEQPVPAELPPTLGPLDMVRQNLNNMQQLRFDTSGATELMKNLKQVNTRIRTEYEERLKKVQELENQVKVSNNKASELQSQVQTIQQQLAFAQSELDQRQTQIVAESQALTELQQSIQQEFNQLRELSLQVQETLQSSIDLGEDMTTTEQLLDLTQAGRSELLKNAMYNSVMSDWTTLWSALIETLRGEPITKENLSNAKVDFGKLVQQKLGNYYQAHLTDTQTRINSSRQIIAGLDEQVKRIQNAGQDSRKYVALRQQLASAVDNYQNMLNLLKPQLDAIADVTSSAPSIWSTTFDALVVVENWNQQHQQEKPTTSFTQGSIPQLLTTLEQRFRSQQLRPRAIVSLWLMRRMLQMLQLTSVPNGDAVSVALSNNAEIQSSPRSVHNAVEFWQFFRNWARETQNTTTGDCEWLSTVLPLVVDLTNCDKLFLEFQPRLGSVETWLQLPYSSEFVSTEMPSSAQEQQVPLSTSSTASSSTAADVMEI